MFLCENSIERWMKLHCAMQIQACTYYTTPGVKLSRGVHVTYY